MKKALLGILTVALLGMAAVGHAGAQSASAPSDALGVPPEVAQHRDDWPLPGRDYENSRARLDSTITRKTVDRLHVAWSTPLPGAGAYGNASSTPLIVGDTVYVQDLGSNVKAIDLETGAVKWSHDYNEFQIGPNGPAIGYGRIYIAAGSQAIAALDATTGEQLWSTRITTTDTEGVSIQPTVVDGLVLAATIPISVQGQFKGGDRGVLYALDAATGAKVWSFDTIKSPNLWGHPELNSGGGAWYTPAVDTKRGLVYWGIANPAPFPGTPEFPNGSSRPGANLYTESVVALHVRTGKLAWYRQAIAHDLFDRDLILTAISRGKGGTRVIGSGKPGRVLALDPASGKVLTETPVGDHMNDELTKLPNTKTKVLPGLFGGVETPLAVAEGVVYTAVLNAPSDYAPNKEDFLGGAKLGVLPGTVAAVDIATGKRRWSTKVPGDPLGGATVVGDLVFTATFQGKIVVLDRATGKIVRSFDAPGGVNGWPAVTRDTIVWPIGMADPPALVAYRLN